MTNQCHSVYCSAS